MKTAKDPRHLHRIAVVQELFSWSFGKTKPSSQLKPVVAEISEIDKLIEKSAPDRPITQINKIDLAILRYSVFELIIMKDTPPKVVLDEAIELGKEFGSDSSSAFINGALGKILEMKRIKT